MVFLEHYELLEGRYYDIFTFRILTVVVGHKGGAAFENADSVVGKRWKKTTSSLCPGEVKPGSMSLEVV